MNSNKNLVIAYNFIAIKEIDNRYIPQPFVANIIDNTLHSFIKKAVPEVLEDFQIIYKNTPHQTLLELCDTLSFIGLRKKYVVNNKNVSSFSVLMADKKTKKNIFQFIDIQLLKIFNILKENTYYLSCFSKNTILLKNHQITFSHSICEPHLYFKKEANGIAYTLKLKINNTLITPQNKKIIIIYNTEGWFILDGLIYKLENINAKKINPFLDKKTLSIPKRMELPFFKNFVLGISKKVALKTEGFQIVHFDDPTKCMLLVYHDFFQKKYCLQVQFWYDTVCFNYDEKRDVNTELTFTNDVIGIKKTKRNFEEEKKYIDVLVDSGLQKTNKQRFTIDQTINSYELIEFLSNQKELFNSKNIDICPLEIDRKSISFQKKSIQFSVTEKIDWFDVYATIKHNQYEFNFIELKPFIKQNNRFFPLPDNTFFIIPLEWMNHHKDLFNFGKTSKKELQLPKSNYPILESLEIKTSLSEDLCFYFLIEN